MLKPNISIFISKLEFGYLPGRQYKIEKRLSVTRQEIQHYLSHSLRDILVFQLLPLIIAEMSGFLPSLIWTTEHAITASYWTMFFKSVAYMVIFDIAAYVFHVLGHAAVCAWQRHWSIHKHVVREHHVHHTAAGGYTYT